MSINKYDSSSGTLTTLASGNRTWIGTTAQYNAAKTAGTLPNNCLIVITDDEQQTSAEEITYDNTNSGLVAENTQDAIDEVIDKIDDKQNKTDNNLTTTSKTITGAINELNNDLSGKLEKVSVYSSTDTKFLILTYYETSIKNSYITAIIPNKTGYHSVSANITPDGTNMYNVSLLVKLESNGDVTVVYAKYRHVSNSITTLTTQFNQSIIVN